MQHSHFHRGSSSSGENGWTWDETQNTHCKFVRSFLKPLPLFLSPSINLTVLIQVEAEMISIRCTMLIRLDDHSKGIQWYCLGRRRKAENLHSISCSHFPCSMDKTQKIVNILQREDSEQLCWALWAEPPAPCVGGVWCLPSRHWERTFQDRGWLQYIA